MKKLQHVSSVTLATLSLLTCAAAGVTFSTLNSNVSHVNATTVAASSNTLSFVDASGKTLTPLSKPSLSGNVGASVLLPTAPAVNGYTFQNVTFNGKVIAAGTHVTLLSSNQINFNYTANAAYTTNTNPLAANAVVSYASTAGGALAPLSPVSLNGKIGAIGVIPAAPQVTNYTFTKVTYNGATVTPGQNQTLGSNKALIYYYTPTRATSAVNYIDNTGKNLVPTQKATLTGNVDRKSVV
jgi:hypothetical protein